MRKLLLVVVLSFLLLGCSQNSYSQNSTTKTLHVYSGAGMRKPMDKIAKMFEDKYGVKVICDYAGSGYLLAKIEATKSGDVFVPGDYIYVKKLMEKGEIVKYKNLTKHIPVIVVQKGNPKHIESLKDLAKPGIRLAIGDRNIAIGIAVNKILDKADKYNPGIKEKILKNVVVKGATVKQVLLYVLEKQVDAAIVWKADAMENKDKLEIIPINESYNVIKTVPIAVLKFSKDRKIANEFYNFTLTKGKKVFEECGFTVI